MKAPAKLDLYKLHKLEYAATGKPALIEARPAQYLAISGRGAPGGDEFTARIGALYGAAFTIKMARKFGGQQDYAVCKLEGQWWCPGVSGNFARVPKSRWHWKLLIRTPDFVRGKELESAVATLLERGKAPEVKEVRLETIHEGRCVQMLHVGPYEREHETMAVMEAHAAKHGLVFSGVHHEIYLSDPRRVAPERLRTILRHPVAPAAGAGATRTRANARPGR
jgi:hypothetical protein